MVTERCPCPTNEAGDIRCHVCREYVNVKCWKCGTPRGEGPCRSRPGKRPTVLDLHQQSIDAHTESINNLMESVKMQSEMIGLLRDRVKDLEGAARAGGVC